LFSEEVQINGLVALFAKDRFTPVAPLSDRVGPPRNHHSR